MKSVIPSPPPSPLMWYLVLWTAHQTFLFQCGFMLLGCEGPKKRIYLNTTSALCCFFTSIQTSFCDLVHPLQTLILQGTKKQNKKKLNWRSKKEQAHFTLLFDLLWLRFIPPSKLVSSVPILSINSFGEGLFVSRMRSKLAKTKNGMSHNVTLC
jgi:uncharacterized protein YhhL (DUF1145 family)